MIAFYVALGLTCAGTLMYEIILTRLLSVLCWYYLAFVSISTAMFGMTAGALAVQLRPDYFSPDGLRKRVAQAAFAMAVSMPLVLMTMLAVPVELSLALETIYSFVLFSAIIAVPFFFSGVTVCLSLTKTSYPIGRVYAADLLGASAGCFGAVLLLKLIDAPSAILVISALLFLSAAAYAQYAGDMQFRKSCAFGAAGLALAAVINAAIPYGIQPIWARGKADDRMQILYEVWNPISKVRVNRPAYGPPDLVTPPPGTPPVTIEYIRLDIDNGASTDVNHFSGDLKTVDAWKIFYEHLKPAGVISFTRWNLPGLAETYRLFAVAYAMLLSEGVANPASQLAVIANEDRATLLASNQPFSESDLHSIKQFSQELGFHNLVLPGVTPDIPEFAAVLDGRSASDLSHLLTAAKLDYSPVYDTSPYFFNPVRLIHLPEIVQYPQAIRTLQPIISLFSFMLAALLLVIFTIILPTKRWASKAAGGVKLPARATVYFVAIGLGFMLAEIAFMEQLSIFLGQPIYSLVVVLAGLILSTGIGSLISDRLRLESKLTSRLPTLATGLAIFLSAALIVPAIHHFVAGVLWQLVAVSLALVGPCGVLMGFCFPVGLRWMARLNQQDKLPWMWAMNGAASSLASFVAILFSMETSILDCLLAGAVC